MNDDKKFPEVRIRWALANSPARFTLLQFVRLYRMQYGHRHKDRDPPSGRYDWKRVAGMLAKLGAQQIGSYAVQETRFANPTQKETPAPTKPSPAPAAPSAPTPAAPTPAAPTPAAPTSTIERLEARLSELQRVVDLQAKIKEVEAQIALF